MLNFDIIERIDELKKPRGWSYNELGEQAEINPNTIYGWKNRNIIPKLTQLEKIAAAFDLTLEEFLRHKCQRFDGRRKRCFESLVFVIRERKRCGLLSDGYV